MLTRLYPIIHSIYENPFTKRMVSLVINFFKPDSVLVGKHRIFIDKDDRVISLELLLSKKWEEYEQRLFVQNIKPGDTVVDVGAHIGTYTLIAAQKTGPTGKVYAFEPLPKNYKLLKKNITVNGYTNVVAINKAVSDKNGSCKLFLSSEDNFGDQRTYDSGDHRSFVNIQTVTLDSFFKNKDQRVNVLKIDIQGSEVRALKGAVKLLAKNHHIKLFTEFWPKALRSAGSSYKQYLNILKKYRFEIFEINSKSEKLTRVSEKKLISDYPEDSNFNADLFCQKA